MQLLIAKRWCLMVLLCVASNTWAGQCRIEKYFKPQSNQEDALIHQLQRFFASSCTKNPRCEINLNKLETINTVPSKDVRDCIEMAKQGCLLNENPTIQEIIASKTVEVSFEGKQKGSFFCNSKGITEIKPPVSQPETKATGVRFTR